MYFLNLFSDVLLSADVMKNVLHLHEDVLFRTLLYCFVASRKKKKKAIYFCPLRDSIIRNCH